VRPAGNQKLRGGKIREAFDFGDALAHQVRSLTIDLYQHGRAKAAAAGIVIADTRFEFGMAGDELLLIDECLTPDSSRFWPAAFCQPGNSPPAPPLPDDVVARTSEKYIEAFKQLTGRKLLAPGASNLRWVKVSQGFCAAGVDENFRAGCIFLPDMRKTNTRALERFFPALLAGLLLGLTGAGYCQESGDRGSVVAGWWDGKYLTGDWFGARDALADRGIQFKGKWVGVYYGVVDSERGSRGFFDQDLSFDAEVDAAKLTGSPALQGWTGFGGVRWRDPRAASNPNTFVEGNPMFNPGRYQSGTQWRLTHFGLGYVSGEVFGIKSFLTLKGGWLQPQKDFIVQPLSLLFVNNAIGSSKGLSYNMPWSSSLSTWGGMLQVKPSNDLYLRGGLYMAAPQATASGNHGLGFEGYAQNPSRNDLMMMAEAGWTPRLGSSRLAGKYAFGGYYFGVDAASFDGKSSSDGVYGFYFQADQMLFREPAAAEKPGSGKSFKAPALPAPASSQGLSMFSYLTFAPSDVNLVSFYFQSGLVYQGLIPGRDSDQAMCAIAYGSYSKDRINALQANGVTDQPNFTMVLEADYRIHVNAWSYVQPYAQYLVRPNGTDAVGNAAVLGFMVGLAF